MNDDNIGVVKITASKGGAEVFDSLGEKLIEHLKFTYADAAIQATALSATEHTRKLVSINKFPLY